MKLPFESAPAIPVASNPTELETSTRRMRLTGLAIQEDACWLYSGGRPLHGYRKNGQGWARISNADAQGKTSTGETLFRVIPAAGVQFSKILFENEGASEVVSLTPSALVNLVENAGEDTSPNLIRIQQNSMEGFWLISRQNPEATRSVTLQGNQWLEGETSSQLLKNAAREDGLTATLFRGSVKNEAWQELYLNIIFEWMTDRVLERYGQLTGRVMIGAVTRDLLLHASRNNLNLSFENNRLTSNSLFASASDMAQSHTACMELITRHIEAVIGIGMMILIMRQIQNSLGPTYLAVARQYGFIFA